MVKMDKVSDVLGSEGREALNGCVKVKIYGRQETQKYNCKQALDRLRPCFEKVVSKPLLICNLECKYFLLDKNGDTSEEEIFDIFDIHNALVRCDELPYVEKYPRPGPRYDEIKESIDKNRAAIEKQCQETTENPEQYSWLAARRLVRDCFAGGFPRDGGVVLNDYLHPLSHWPYSVDLIHQSVCFWDSALSNPELCEHARSKIDAYAKSQNRESIARYAEPPSHIPHAGAKHRYSIALSLVDNDEYPFKPCEDPHCRDSYNIIDIDQAVEYLEEKKMIYRQQEDDCPGSDANDLKRRIYKCRTEVNEENKKPRGFYDGVEYSWFEVERRVRDCFSGPGPVETDVLLSKKGRDEEVKVSKANQTYDIFEIKAW